MTHRQIQAIPINGFEPGGSADGKPIFEWMSPADLLVDSDYQRDLSERSLKLIRRIVSNWDWKRFKSPVAVWTDVGFEVIDGQCTAIAAATHPDIVQIPVMVVEAPEKQERAAAFIGHNRDRIAVTPAQLHVAAVTAGIEEAQAVDRVAKAAGVTLLRRQAAAGHYKPGETMAIGAVDWMVRLRGEESAAKVLHVLACSGVAPITSVQMKAADLLLNDPEYAGQMTNETLLNVIRTMGPKGQAEAAIFRAAHPTVPLWKALGITWFQNRRRVRKLEIVPAVDVQKKPSDAEEHSASAAPGTEPAFVPERTLIKAADKAARGGE
jgi:hypothetical protein